jgi:hypothetical protein
MEEDLCDAEAAVSLTLDVLDVVDIDLTRFAVHRALALTRSTGVIGMLLPFAKMF